MPSHYLLVPMFAHILWITLLYCLLTIARAPSIWGIGANGGTNFWSEVEPRISANLSNQFEWPLLFYVVCLLLILVGDDISIAQIWIAWLFILGRVLHSAVQILTTNIRLRGLVFTINFLAVFAMWCLLLQTTYFASA